MLYAREAGGGDDEEGEPAARQAPPSAPAEAPERGGSRDRPAARQDSGLWTPPGSS